MSSVISCSVGGGSGGDDSSRGRNASGSSNEISSLAGDSSWIWDGEGCRDLVGLGVDPRDRKEDPISRTGECLVPNIPRVGEKGKTLPLARGDLEGVTIGEPRERGSRADISWTGVVDPTRVVSPVNCRRRFAI
jgi:hypothetical protein